jgi:hypothetical protein
MQPSWWGMHFGVGGCCQAGPPALPHACLLHKSQLAKTGMPDGARVVTHNWGGHKRWEAWTEAEKQQWGSAYWYCLAAPAVLG